MIIDATRSFLPHPRPLSTDVEKGVLTPSPSLKQIDPRILESKVLEDCLLVVKVNSGRESAGMKDVLKKILERTDVQGFKLIALVSEDVPLEDDVLLIWGIFTRFDCERDVLFPRMELRGARAVHSGPLGIDATWKKGYPEPVEMSPEVVEKVTRRWREYGLD